MSANRDPFQRLAALAPVVFIAHFAEEAPGFVDWFNSHVSPGITPALFWQVNITCLVVTLIVSAVTWFDDSAASATFAVAWFSFLMGANAFVHIAGAMVDRGYVPGLVTAVVLYVPYFAFLFFHATKRGARIVVLLTIAVIAALPMVIHGYRIVFLGTRLF